MSANEQMNAVTGRGTGGRVLRMMLGAVAGYAAVTLLFRVAGPALPRPVQPDAIVALGVACVYMLMGLFVGLGTVLPRAGAKMLNVADADELHDDRRILISSSLGSFLSGAGLMILALAGSGGGSVSQPVALAATLITLLASVSVYLWGGRGQDEYRRLINAETSQVALYLAFVLFGGWAMLAQLGYAAMFTPLSFLSGMMVLVLVAAFWIIVRRGMIVKG